jgi:hypothetical protein
MKKKRTLKEQIIIKKLNSIDDLKEPKKRKEIEAQLKYGKIIKIEKIN